MKCLYTTLAIIAIFIVTLFTFQEDLIYYNYAKFKINNDKKLTENSYYYEDNFSYINNYSNLEIHNKEELYEAIYYIVNSGVSSAKRYFSIDYTDFEKDYNELFSNSNKIKLYSINNFVHPYNTFDSILVNLKGYELEINVIYKDSYNEKNINLINNEVDRIIKNLITPDMSDIKKIKTIHDYIINNTIYDKDFCVEEDKKKCKTNSPYQADTAYGVLFEHHGICSGYTDLMAIFLNKLNIINYRVTNDNHTWNAVKLDNIWYHLDATWDDPISETNILTHTYFIITTQEDSKQKESHIFDKEIFIELS